MFDKNILDYLEKFNIIDSPFLNELQNNNGMRNDVQPHINVELGRLLNFLILVTKSKRILELGTSNGFSAIFMGEAVKKIHGKIISIDSKERLHLEAVENIKNQGLTPYIDVIFGDAEEIIEKMDEPFDLVFQDCGKYLYPKLFEKIFKLTKPGGIIIADDTLFKPNPEIRESLSNYVDHYNKMVFNDPRLYSVILPVGAGITLSWRKI
jgi:predicted O-methyltransferase YrrM